MVESTFGDGPANFCEICPNGSSLGVIKKRKKKYNMHDMTSNQKHTKNDLLRLKNKSVDERKDFFFAKNAMELSKAMPKLRNKLPLQNKMGK